MSRGALGWELHLVASYLIVLYPVFTVYVLLFCVPVMNFSSVILFVVF